MKTYTIRIQDRTIATVSASSEAEAVWKLISSSSGNPHYEGIEWSEVTVG